MADELAGQMVGGWRIGSSLGNGHSAVVLVAERGEKTAALKIIDPEMVEQAGRAQQISRIMREKELAGHGHPHLVEILDGGECACSGYLFVAMELLDPLTLDEIRETLPRDRIAPLIAQLASAARFLEEREFCHRDIKPANIVVTPDFEKLKLLDLGVIRPYGNLTAGTGEKFLGTARYSPTEYLHGKVDDSILGWRALTFYQLGATLYDLLTRKQIFVDLKEPPARLYEAIKELTPPLHVDDAEPWLVDLARRCLNKDWRTRSTLVKWSDFDGPPPASTPQMVRDRLRKRMKAGTKAPEAQEAGPIGRRVLERIAGAISTTAREVCGQGETFPPVEVLRHVEATRSVIHVRTGPSLSHDLAGLLDIVLVVDPVDTGAVYVRISAAARLGAPSPRSDDVEEIYVGELAGGTLRDALDSYLHETLERAMGTGLPPSEGLSLSRSKGSR